MSKDEGQLLYEELDRRRGTESLSPTGIINAAKSIGVELTVGQFIDAVVKLDPRHRETNIFPWWIIEFICRYAAETHPQSILDPWAGFGLLLIPLATVAEPKRAVGITPIADDLDVAKELDNRKAISWCCDRPFEKLDSIEGSFD